MKRWLVRICVLLLLGAIVNVAVAWGCAGWSGTHATESAAIAEMPDRGLSRWASDVGRGNWPDRWLLRGKGCEMLMLLSSPDGRALYAGSNIAGVQKLRFVGDDNAPIDRFVVVRSGWPTRSLGGSALSPGISAKLIDRYHENSQREGVIVLEAPHSDVPRFRLLPLIPIWPGFAINTVFYAFVLWLLFAAPFALRRLRGGRRIKRGLCPKCAYPRGAGTNAVCTECGAAVGGNSAVE